MITTHILDTSLGRPASDVPVVLEHFTPDGWRAIGSGKTDADGRLRDLTDGSVPAGNYRLIFEVGGYFLDRGTTCFFPSVVVAFLVDDAGQHYHVPLLISPFGYSTYRGS